MRPRRTHAASLAAEVAFGDQELGMRLRARYEWLRTLATSAIAIGLIVGFQVLHRWAQILALRSRLKEITPGRRHRGEPDRA